MWTDIKGYENRYQVNESGEIRSLAFQSIKRIKLLKHTKTDAGYMTVCLYKNDGGITNRVNRIVASAFHPNPENKPFVDHIDGVKTNNSASNLRWVTHKENMLGFRTILPKCPTCGHRCKKGS